MQHHANPDDVARAAAGWDDDMLECREGHHDFSPQSQLDAGFDDDEKTFFRVRRCPRCLTEQHKIWSQRTGERLRSWLDYSGTKEGYLLPKGTGRITSSARTMVALEMMHRLRPPQLKPAKRTRRRRAA